MRAIDADALTEDCKRYLGTLNPDKDGKECLDATARSVPGRR